jgi:hypothetical protein
VKRVVLVALLGLALGAAAAPADAAPTEAPTAGIRRQITDLPLGPWPASPVSPSTLRNEIVPSSSRVAR